MRWPCIAFVCCIKVDLFKSILTPPFKNKVQLQHKRLHEQKFARFVVTPVTASVRIYITSSVSD